MLSNGKERYEIYRRRGLDWKTVLGKRKIRYDEIFYSYPLKSEKLKLRGVADVIYRVGEAYRVLEVKYSVFPGKIPLDHLMQTVTYAVILESEMNRFVDRIDIYYVKSDRYVWKNYNQSLKALWKRYYDRILRLLQGVYQPKVTRIRNRCKACFFFRDICLGYLER